jgi:hypothetical protein
MQPSSPSLTGQYLDILLYKTVNPGRKLEDKCHCEGYNDKKLNTILLISKEIQNGAVAKSYMANGLLIYGEIFAHFLIY